MMRVSDQRGVETEALGPAILGGIGSVYLVRGEWVPYQAFRESFTPQPERRHQRTRRAGDRRARRVGSRRVYCRRMRDRSTERELLQLARGIEHVEISMAERPEYHKG
jgi:hypothetical protein